MKRPQMEESNMGNLFVIRFLISSCILSILILLIMVIKKVFEKHISAKWHYNMWLVVLMMLIIPFVPRQVFDFGNQQQWRKSSNQLEQVGMQNSSDLNDKDNSLMNRENGLQDFALSVDYSFMNGLNQVVFWIWLIGGLSFLCLVIKGNRQIRKIKNSTKVIQNKEMKVLFEQCKEELEITTHPILGESKVIQTPMALGIRKTYIILPAQNMEQLSRDDVRYIMLHELSHYKNKDIVVGYIVCFFQILYWFNPLVHIAFKMMRRDREIACDREVLKRLDEKNYIDYGRTIINFAELIAQPSYINMATGIAGSKQEIKARIQKIAVFKPETKLIQIKSLVIFILIGLLILSQAPSISIMAYDTNHYQFQEQQVQYEDLSSYFNEIEGSFVMYDVQKEQYSIYNKEKSTKRVAPNSTYKIYSALIALEEGIIQKENLVLDWNGEKNPYKEWDGSQDLYSAMKHSVNWYFQRLDEAVGKEKLQYYFDQIGYGNANIGRDISNYWMESSLRISPVEQVELLKAMYTGQSVFELENVNLVKQALKISEKNGAILSGKTGTGIVNDKGTNGWFIGYVEQGEQTYIFATNIEGQDGMSGSLATEITLEILKDKHIY